MSEFLAKFKMHVKITLIAMLGIVSITVILYGVLYRANKEMLEDKINVISGEAVEQARVYLDSEFNHLIQLVHGGIIGYDITTSVNDYTKNKDSISFFNIQDMLTQFVVQSKLLYSVHLVIEEDIISSLSKSVSYDVNQVLKHSENGYSLYFHDTVIIDKNGQELLPFVLDLSKLSISTYSNVPPDIYIVFNIKYSSILNTLGELKNNVFGDVRLLNADGFPLIADGINVDDYDQVYIEKLKISGWNIQILQKDEVLFAEFYESQKYGSYALLALVLLFALIVYYIAKGITTPLKSLTKMAGRLQRQDYSTKLVVKGADEIAVLGKAFLQLQDELILYEKIVEEDKERIKQDEADKRKIEMRLLHEQMNPHFLYNTLDSIYWYAVGGERENVCNMIVKLSQMLRIGLSKGDEYITLEQEVKHLESYLSIQKQVFGDKFNYEINFDKTLENTKILKIILQPLVENSIIHGFADLEFGGFINVNVKRVENQLVLQVVDNGVGFKGSSNKPVKGSKFALKTLNRRLELHYQENASVEHYLMENSLTCVEVRIAI